jgi:predicted O-methyltransferase YrrM
MIKYVCTVILFFGVISSYSLVGSDERQSSLEWKKHYRKEYDFTFDNTFRGFIDGIPVWNKILHPLKGKPAIHYLEIGVNQGRSALWVLETILTHPTARLTGIDIFPEGTDFKDRYLSNLKLSGAEHKATTIEGFSQIALRKLPLNTFDIIYIDGDHSAGGVLADAVLGFQLLKTDGILIFDDYRWFEERLPEELRPRIAIDSFITSYRNALEVVHRGYQVFIQKRENPCDHFPIPPIGCTSFGQYVYVWNWNGNNELYRQAMDEPLKLSNREKQLIESLIRSTTFGSETVFPDDAMVKDKDYIQLRERLKLDFTNSEIAGE